MKDNRAVTKKIDVYDPAMCCSTGVCGPDVDDSLTDFANDVKWMKSQGIEVNRFNLGQEPEAFKSNPVVIARLQNAGSDILPIIFINGERVSEGAYPDRNQLKDWFSLNGDANNENRTPGVDSHELLIRLEMAVANGDGIELQSRFREGEENGISKEELVQAMQKGIDKRQQVTQSILETANELLGVQPGGCTPGGGCC